MIEQWKDIEGYENEYQVSTLGNIKSLKNNIILKQNYNKRFGRYSVMLWKNGISKRYFVARLVAQAFIPNPDNLPQVNHKDEDKTNNHVENLEWCTCQYNLTYGTRSERHDQKVSKVVNVYNLNKVFLKTYTSIKNAAEELHINSSDIVKVCKGKRKRCRQYIFEYA